MAKLKTEVKTEVKKTSPEKKTGLEIPVYDIKGKEKGVFELLKEPFSVTAKPQLLAQAIRVYQFNQRQGTASTKTRGEVVGSTRKIYRQKGTGRARHGDIKAPIFVGGGTVGGPKPKNFSLEITKKQRKKAFFGALTLKFKEKNLAALEDAALKMEAKTKSIASFLEETKMSGKKILFVVPKMDNNNFILASRNIDGVSLTDVQSLNIFQVFNNSKIIFLESALEIFKNRFLKNEH